MIQFAVEARVHVGHRVTHDSHILCMGKQFGKNIGHANTRVFINLKV